EQVLWAPVLAGGRLHVATQVVAADPCLPLASRAWNVDVLSGLSDSALTAARPGSALLRSLLAFQSGRAGVPDAFGRRSSSQLYSVLFQEPGIEPGGAANAGSAVHAGQGPAGRLSWREIVDWKPPRESARAP
ncbi:MAG: hypothetical protein Q7U14_03065, partial [Lacisediminimonas sp.]|nr:hypothetical protein [Lacisediminimonas sp.]